MAEFLFLHFFPFFHLFQGPSSLCPVYGLALGVLEACSQANLVWKSGTDRFRNPNQSPSSEWVVCVSQELSEVCLRPAESTQLAVFYLDHVTC